MSTRNGHPKPIDFQPPRYAFLNQPHSLEMHRNIVEQTWRGISVGKNI